MRPDMDSWMGGAHEWGIPIREQILYATRRDVSVRVMSGVLYYTQQ